MSRGVEARGSNGTSGVPRALGWGRTAKDHERRPARGPDKEYGRWRLGLADCLTSFLEPGGRAYRQHLWPPCNSFRTFKPYPPMAPKAPRFGHTIQRDGDPQGRVSLGRSGRGPSGVVFGRVRCRTMDAKTNLKSRLPSRHATEGPDRAPHRAFYYAMGLTPEQIHQPFVGVATCWNEAAPCNIALMRQAQVVKKGVAAVGATPREFCTITVTGWPLKVPGRIDPP